MPPQPPPMVAADEAANNTLPLWQTAFDSLDEEHKKKLPFVHNSDSVNPKLILDTVTEKKTSCRQKGWTIYKKKNRDEVKLIDILDKISGWIKRFVKTGDFAVQFDSSGHSAIPWLAVKSVLQLSVASFDAFGSMVESIEKVSRIIALFAGPVFFTKTSRETQLSASLLELYKAILTFLADAYAYFSGKPTKRIWDGLKSIAKDDPMKQIEELENAVCELENLTVHEYEVRMLRDLDEHMAFLEAETRHIREQTDHTAVQVDRIDRDRILNCIGGIPMKQTYETALRDRLKGTCKWVLQLEELSAWQSGDPTRPKLLWIHGPPGFGKTVLSASITEHLKETMGDLVAYFFCVADNQPSRDPYAILRSWLTQALETSDQIFTEMHSRYKNRRQTDVLTHGELWDLFVAVGSSSADCIFVVDGFDECTGIDSAATYHSQDPRNYFLRDLMQRLPKTRSRILVVSRDVADIREYLGQKSAEAAPLDMFEYGITAADTASDVKSFSEAMVNRNLDKKKEDVRQKIALKAAERSDGMFLWVKLLEKQLSPGKNAKQLEDIVSNMPSGLNKAYDRELEAIAQLDQPDREKAFMVLRWVLFAWRPLDVKELVEALAVSDDNLEAYPRDQLPDGWDNGFVNKDEVNTLILNRCGSLLQLRASSSGSVLASPTVHLVHFSLKEYLSTRRQILEAQGQFPGFPDTDAEEAHLSKICLRYLAWKFKTKRLNRRLYPFLSYASYAWYYHGYKGKPTLMDNNADLTREIFHPDKSSWQVWGPISEQRWLEECSKHWDHHQRHLAFSIKKYVPAQNSIYYACLFGLDDVVEWLAGEHTQDINYAGGCLGCPLLAAIAGNHLGVVTHLLECGIATKQSNEELSLAVVAAVVFATPKIVEVLLTTGVDIDPDFKVAGSTSLEHAVRRDSVDIVRHLLIHYAQRAVKLKNSTMECKDGTEPTESVVVFDVAGNERDTLCMINALQHGHLNAAAAMIDFLPHAAIAAPVRGGYPGNATLLHHAIRYNAVPIVKKLLCHQDQARRADVNFVSDGCETALQWAVTEGADPEVVRLLLDAGASLMGVFQESQLTLFGTAFRKGMLSVAEMLVRCGCFSSEKRPRKLTTRESLPARVFLSGGNVEKLNGPGIFQDSLDEALRLAAAQNYTSIAANLLSRGAQPAAQDMNGRTALHYAAAGMHKQLTDFLLKSGAQLALALEDMDGYTPIELAIARGVAADSFLREHAEEHFCWLSQSGLLPLTENTTLSAPVSPDIVRAALVGTWKGLCHWKRRLYAEVELEFPKMDASISYQFDTSSIPQFSIHSFVDSAGVVWFSFLTLLEGLQFTGQLDADQRTMRGIWGRNSQQWLGTFEVEKTLQEGKEE